MRKTILALALAMMATAVFGQRMYQGDYDLRPGMSYREYSDYYNPRLYQHQFGDPYSRFLAGAASFFVPGLGQICDGEWGRGLGFLAGNVGLAILANNHKTEYYDAYGHKQIKVDGAWPLFQAARIVLNIWSICDAVRVAKIKNMYYQDIYGRYSGIDAKFEPFFSCVPSGNQQNTAALGMTFKLNF